MTTTPARPVPPASPLARAFGGQSMTAPLREALLKAPGPAFGRAFEDPAHGFLHACDLDVARREHAAFSDLLASLGTTVHQLDVEIDSPDLVYAFDPLLVTDRGAIPLRPGKPNRSQEPAAIEAWTSARGIPTVGRIEAPGTIEGGDTFWLRPDLFCIGRTLRGVFTDPSLRRYLLGDFGRNRIFAVTLLRIWIAYLTGALRYAVFTAAKTG